MLGLHLLNPLYLGWYHYEAAVYRPCYFYSSLQGDLASNASSRPTKFTRNRDPSHKKHIICLWKLLKDGVYRNKPYAGEELRAGTDAIIVSVRYVAPIVHFFVLLKHYISG
jgi:hypothetical protein